MLFRSLRSANGASSAQFEQALEEVVFQSHPSVLSTAERSVDFTATACTKDLNGVEVCGTPACTSKVDITLCAACLPSIAPLVARSTFEQASPTGVLASPSAIVKDQDSIHMKNATVQLVNCHAGDALLWTASAGVDVDYDAATCKMTLNAQTSTTSVTKFDETLQSVQFKSTKIAGLSFAARTITYQVVDNDRHVSPPATRMVDVKCAPGFYADSVTSTCLACAAGTWQDTIHASSCTSCEKGTFGAFGQSQASSEYCQACETGSYTDEVGQTMCTHCAASTVGVMAQPKTSIAHCKCVDLGSYQPLTGQAAGAEVVCEDGFFCAPEVSGGCPVRKPWTSCTKNGEKQTDGSTTTDAQCVPCMQGTFLYVGAEPLLHSRRSCTWCAEGKHGAGNVDVNTASHCVDCAVGTFSKYTIDVDTNEKAFPITTCASCAAGTFTNDQGQTACTACDQGKYSATGAIVCDSCAKGRYGNADLSQGSADHCAECAAGKYQDEAASTSCKACACGTFQPLKGQEKCTQCAVGTFLAVPANPTVAPMIACSSCSAGKFAGKGACGCTDCPKGEFCPQGETCGTGAQKIVSAAGFVTHAQTAGVCKACGAGKYNDWFGQSTCSHCPDGQFQDATSYTECHACSPGQFSKSVAGSVNAVCTNCNPGHFAGSAGSDSCTVCPAGKFTESRFGGAITCSTCVAGKFSAAAATECTSCAAGTYQPAVESSDCTKCGAGKFNSLAGQSSAFSCKACLSGTYSTATGQSSCENNWKCCDKGEYLHFGSSADLNTKSGECKTCPAGKFQDKSEVCTPDLVCKDLSEVYSKCAVGEFLAGSSAGSAGTCTSCPAGKFKPEEANPKAWATLGCTDCPAGQFGTEVAQVGAATCKNCAAGKYSSSAGQSTCEACAAGTFSPVKSTSCRTCGTTSDWSDFGACTASCGGGTKTRTRTVVGVPGEIDVADREAQCPTTETLKCNVASCPKTDQCHFLKCRYAENPATGKFGIQVYHHGK